MKRRLIIALGLALAAGILLISRRQTGRALARLGRQPARMGPRQWDLDRAALRALMDRVVAEQRRRVGEHEAIPDRARAQAFLDYYERRRAAL
jgi:hypothetical protein